jgi:iron-sulfur cluster repair protein YtfE (RIC family)
VIDEEGVMKRPWASFLEAHAALRGEIASACRAAADSAATNEASLGDELGELHGLLAHGLLRHMDVEDRVLYPALARAEGPMSVDLLAADHRAIARLEREVALAETAVSHRGLGPDERRKLVRTLHGLEMVVDLHMTKEEEICLPTLDRELEAAMLRDLETSLETLQKAELLAE